MDGQISGSAAMAAGTAGVLRGQHYDRWTDERTEQMCDLLREGLGYRVIAEKLGCSRSSIAGRVKRLRRSDLTILPQNRREPARTNLDLALPADFAAVAEGNSQEEIAAHYGVGIKTVCRWLDDAGLDRTARHAAPARVQKSRQRNSTIPTAANGRLAIDRPSGLRLMMSPAAPAAEFLQRYGPVYRCDADGNPDPRGTHWRRGSFVLTDDELMQRARDKGWDPERWRQLAA
jgi:transposase